MSFSKAVNKFAVEVQEANEEIIRGTAIALFRDIIFSSPVDTGRFRANWFVSGRDPSSRVTDSTDKSGQNTVKTMETEVLNKFDWFAFTLTNNLPYSEVIEFGGYPTPSEGDKTQNGYSKQAPAGVVRVNSTRFERLLEEEARRVGYGRI